MAMKYLYYHTVQTLYPWGVLTFKGANLDQITEIDLPGAEAITSINVVTSGKTQKSILKFLQKNVNQVLLH